MVEKVTYEKLFYHIPKRRKATREREREREKQKDSQANSICIATPDSNKRHSDNSILGFPIVRGNWCNSNLKLNCLRISSFNRERKLVYTTQTEGFLIAPLNKAQRKILFSTLEQQPMNQKELNDIVFQVKSYRSLISDGMKNTAESGVKKTIYYRLFIRLLQEADVGSVIIRAQIHCDFYEKITQNFGIYYLNGIVIAQQHSKQMVEQYMIMTSVSKQKMTV